MGKVLAQELFLFLIMMAAATVAITFFIILVIDKDHCITYRASNFDQIIIGEDRRIEVDLFMAVGAFHFYIIVFIIVFLIIIDEIFNIS